MINERQEQLDRVVARMLPPAPPAAVQRSNGRRLLGDRELLDRAFAARNGARMEALYRGDTSAYGGDRSRADLALCRMLAFWTEDPEQLDRLVRGSGLYRRKWEREDYRQRTIETALGQRTRAAA